jgi:hypothetical protein
MPTDPDPGLRAATRPMPASTEQRSMGPDSRAADQWQIVLTAQSDGAALLYVHDAQGSVAEQYLSPAERRRLAEMLLDGTL